MNIIEFFELSAGQWFSQRTVHDLVSGKLQAGKSNLVIEFLPSSDANVVQLCQQHETDPSLVWGGLQLSWEGTVDGNSKKQIGSTTLVAVRHAEKEHEGLLLQSRSGLKSLKGRYIMGEDEVLTLITESVDFYAEERLWYLIPNLRLRTSLVKRKDGLNQGSFCSEIRKMT
ncbi:MAG: phycobiliprotein lyase [Microcoleaceae cyanobacterium]